MNTSDMSSPVTSHVLDTAAGKPASGVPVRIEQQVEGEWIARGAGATDGDGRVRDLLAPGSLAKGEWRVTFDTGRYFEAQGARGFYPYVQVVFAVADAGQHYHIPLLLSPYGYSTYRGS